jgi:hypothetical protein
MQESPIFSRTYDLLAWLIPQANKFPRAHRFGLGERLVCRALDFQETLIAAGLVRSGKRKELLEQADVQLAQLRQWLRLGKDLELLSIRQYEHAASMVNEIGRLLGGWMKMLHPRGQVDGEAVDSRRLVEQQQEQRPLRVPEQERTR